MLHLRNPFYTMVLPLVFKKSEVVLAKNFAPSFKEQPDRFSKPATINTSVFFEIVIMVFLETKIDSNNYCK